MITLKSSALHRTTPQATAMGTIRSVEHLVASLEDSLADAKLTPAAARRRLTDLQVQTTQPFEYVEKLAALLQRQQELFAALDLAKNKAAETLDSTPIEPPPLECDC